MTRGNIPPECWETASESGNQHLRRDLPQCRDIVLDHGDPMLLAATVLVVLGLAVALWWVLTPVRCDGNSGIVTVYRTAARKWIVCRFRAVRS